MECLGLAPPIIIIKLNHTPRGKVIKQMSEPRLSQQAGKADMCDKGKERLDLFDSFLRYFLEWQKVSERK